MHSKEIEEKKRLLKLTDLQKEILIGTLLGDGHLETQDNGHTYRLKLDHSIKQRAYVDWLYESFKEWTNTPPKKHSRDVRFRNVTKSYDKYGFNTVSHSAFRFYAKQFYSQRKKKAPRLIHRWLTPLALAVWFMDDGSIKSNAHKTVFINTHSFSKDDVKRLRKALWDVYGIQTILRPQGNGNQLYFLSETVEAFLGLIEPHILPSMRYKLPKVWLTQLPKR